MPARRAPARAARLDAALARRLKREPVSRIVGRREFYGRLSGSTASARPARGQRDADRGGARMSSARLRDDSSGCSISAPAPAASSSRCWPNCRARKASASTGARARSLTPPTRAPRRGSPRGFWPAIGSMAQGGFDLVLATRHIWPQPRSPPWPAWWRLRPASRPRWRRRRARRLSPHRRRRRLSVLAEQGRLCSRSGRRRRGRGGNPARGRARARWAAGGPGRKAPRGYGGAVTVDLASHSAKKTLGKPRCSG